MKREYEDRGIRIFVFHDDNFLVPSVEQNLERCGEMKSLLQAESIRNVALVVKCRPPDVNGQVFELLKSMR